MQTTYPVAQKRTRGKSRYGRLASQSSILWRRTNTTCWRRRPRCAAPARQTALPFATLKVPHEPPQIGAGYGTFKGASGTRYYSSSTARIKAPCPFVHRACKNDGAGLKVQGTPYYMKEAGQSPSFPRGAADFPSAFPLRLSLRFSSPYLKRFCP